VRAAVAHNMYMVRIRRLELRMYRCADQIVPLFGTFLYKHNSVCCGSPSSPNFQCLLCGSGS
jgi:hypothetical protein